MGEAFWLEYLMAIEHEQIFRARCDQCGVVVLLGQYNNPAAFVPLASPGLPAGWHDYGYLGISCPDHGAEILTPEKR